MGEYVVTIIKLVIVILLIPVILAGLFTLYAHLDKFYAADLDFFIWGMISFIFVYVFLYKFWGIYEFGQKFMQGLFRFFAPAHKFIAYLIPFYAIAITLLNFVFEKFLNITSYSYYFVFFLGFSLAMHLVLTAQDLQESENTSVKPTYLISITIILLVLLCLTILLFDLVASKWTFFTFIKSVIDASGDYYMGIIRSLMR